MRWTPIRRTSGSRFKSRTTFSTSRATPKISARPLVPTQRAPSPLTPASSDWKPPKYVLENWNAAHVMASYYVFCPRSEPIGRGRIDPVNSARSAWRAYECCRPRQEADIEARGGRARPCRYASNADQPVRHQGYLSSDQGEGSRPWRATHRREFQHVREFAPQLQRHAHVPVRGDSAPARA